MFALLQTNKRPEPIYAEPTKITLPPSSSTNSSKDSSQDESNDEVVLRQKTIHKSEISKTDGPKLTLCRNSDGIDVDMPNRSVTDDKSRHSDTILLKEMATARSQTDTTDGRAVRRYHTKSLSLSENRVAQGAQNLFHQNRELWQQRAAGKSQQSLTTPRILSRNRIAPDLVMDLPVSSLADSNNRASRESLESESEDLTSAERFATQNQCTLKKNDRYVLEEAKKEVKLEQKANNSDKPKAEVKPQQEGLIRTPTVEIKSDSNEQLLKPADTEYQNSTKSGSQDNLLHIDESAGEKSPARRELSKSPIPLHNTQKFASQFAGLHLTGGCLTKADSSVTASISSSSSVAGSSNQQQQPNLSSFKPQVKVKPQILKKPLVLPPATPEMGRRSSNHD